LDTDGNGVITFHEMERLEKQYRKDAKGRASVPKGENNNEYALVIAGQLSNRNLSRNERQQLKNQAFGAQYQSPQLNWVKGDFVRPEIKGAKPQKLSLHTEEGLVCAEAMKQILKRGVVHHKARNRHMQHHRQLAQQGSKKTSGIKANYHTGDDHAAKGYAI
jgi:hypothetical protein